MFLARYIYRVICILIIQAFHASPMTYNERSTSDFDREEIKRLIVAIGDLKNISEYRKGSPIHEYFTESEIDILKYYLQDVNRDERSNERMKSALNDLREAHESESESSKHKFRLDFTNDDNLMLTVIDDMAAVLIFSRHTLYSDAEIGILNLKMQNLKDYYLESKGRIAGELLVEMIASLEKVHASSYSSHSIELDFNTLLNLPPTFLGRTLRTALEIFEDDTKILSNPIVDKFNFDAEDRISEMLTKEFSSNLVKYLGHKLFYEFDLIVDLQTSIEKELESLNLLTLSLETKVREFNDIVEKSGHQFGEFAAIKSKKDAIEALREKMMARNENIQKRIDREHNFIRALFVKEGVAEFKYGSGNVDFEAIPEINHALAISKEDGLSVELE